MTEHISGFSSVEATTKHAASLTPTEFGNMHKILFGGAPLNMKIDQIAFAAYNDEDERRIKSLLGLDNAEWVEDNVIARGEVDGEPGENTAKLLFNYDYGIEVEILRYTDGPNYLSAQNIQAGQICHIGMHYTGEGEVPSFGPDIIQQVETQSHTNPFLLEEGRKYRYTIYNTRHIFGQNFKVIERLQ